MLVNVSNGKVKSNEVLVSFVPEIIGIFIGRFSRSNEPTVMDSVHFDVLFLDKEFRVWNDLHDEVYHRSRSVKLSSRARVLSV